MWLITDKDYMNHAKKQNVLEEKGKELGVTGKFWILIFCQGFKKILLSVCMPFYLLTNFTVNIVVIIFWYNYARHLMFFCVISAEHINAWWKTNRDSFTKLSRKKSGEQLSDLPYKQRWMLTKFSFLKQRPTTIKAPVVSVSITWGDFLRIRCPA